MSALSVNSPFQTFTDRDGQPLEDGYIYIGTAGLPAEANPQSIYWDAALAIPASQPVRTLGGYPMRSGSPATIYVDGNDYSVAVKNKNSTLVFQSLNVNERIALIQGGTGGSTQAEALLNLGALASDTVALSGAYTVVAADRGKVFNSTGTWTLSLTAAATLGDGFSFGVVNSGSGAITIDPSGAELIDGASTIILSAGQTCFVTCTGTAFLSIGKPTASSASAQGQNVIINGAMAVAQRGTSIAFASNDTKYALDRWYGTAPNAAFTLAQVASGLTGITNALRFQRNSGQTGVGTPSLSQSLESRNSTPLAGQNVTLSFYARAGANYSAASGLLTAQIRSGTGTDQNIGAVAITGDTTVAASNVTLTTSWQRFEITGTAGSGINQLFARFAYGTVGTAGANDYFEITGIQLETGSVATAFQHQQASADLNLCKRYFMRISIASGQITGPTGMAQSATVSWFSIQNVFRSTPSGVSASNLQILQGNTNIAVTAVVAVYNYNSGCSIGLSVAAGLIATSSLLLYASGTTGILDIPAEI